MQPAVQKSAMKEQHEFQEGNMVPTKLVEWADTVIDNVVYITVGKARNMIFVVKMPGQHTHKKERDTRRQIIEDKPGIWAGFKVWVEVAMMVYTMELEDRLIYLCKGYAGQEKVIMVEVYVMKMENRLTIKDNDMGVVFKMEYTTAGMQKRRTVEEEDIYMSVEVVRTAIVEVVRTAIMEVVRTAIVEVVRTAITKEEYNTAEIERNLSVKKRDINMFEDSRMMNVDMVKFVVIVKGVFYNVIEDTNTGIVVNFKSVEVVGTVIIVGKMNIMIEGYVMQKEKLTVQGGDINKFEAIHMMDAVIIKFVEVVINEEEYNMAEVYEELTVEEGDIYMFEDIHMRNVNNVKFMEVADMIILQYVEVVKKEKGTKKQEDFWSFRDNGDKTLSYLGGLGR
jgi:hypothetical protein